MSLRLIWISRKMVIPPWINCMHHLLQVTYDPKTQQIHNFTGVNVLIHDFGGIDSIDYVVKSLYGHLKLL